MRLVKAKVPTCRITFQTKEKYDAMDEVIGYMVPARKLEKHPEDLVMELFAYPIPKDVVERAKFLNSTVEDLT